MALAASHTDDAIATLVSDSQHVHLDPDPWSGDLVLCSDISCDRVFFSDYVDGSLFFDDSGASAVTLCRTLDDEDPTVVIASEHLGHDVFLDGGGKLLIVKVGETRPVYLSDLLDQFEQIEVTITRGALASPGVFKAVMLHRVRCGGLTVDWSLHSLYDLLQLTVHSGQRWNWVYRSVAKHCSSSFAVPCRCFLQCDASRC